jgi:hypothetical protein
MVKYLEADAIVSVIEDPLPWQKAGLQQTASGYGRKLFTTRKLVMTDRRTRRTRRIYVCNYSNSGTAYVIVDGEWLVIGPEVEYKIHELGKK